MFPLFVNFFRFCIIRAYTSPLNWVIDLWASERSKIDSFSDYNSKFRHAITRNLTEKKDYSELSLPLIMLLLSCTQKDIVTKFQHDWVYQAENHISTFATKFQAYIMNINSLTHSLTPSTRSSLSLSLYTAEGREGGRELTIHHIFNSLTLSLSVEENNQ